MAISTPTTPGQILTSAYLNNNINSAGTVVKSQVVGAGVASVNVPAAFSATYDYYKIIYVNGVGSTSASMNFQLGATIIGYTWAIVIGRYDGVGSLSGGAANDTVWKNVGFSDADGNLFEMELSMPFLARKTGFKAWHWDTRFGGGTGFGSSGGHLRNTTSYTDFTLSVTAGTMTGGTIIVYGYRNP